MKKELSREKLIELADFLKSGVGIGVACRSVGIYETEFYAKYRRDPIIDQAMDIKKGRRLQSFRSFYGEPQPKKRRKNNASRNKDHK
jgi:hypothetical protein